MFFCAPKKCQILQYLTVFWKKQYTTVRIWLYFFTVICYNVETNGVKMTHNMRLMQHYYINKANQNNACIFKTWSKPVNLDCYLAMMHLITWWEKPLWITVYCCVVCFSCLSICQGKKSGSAALHSVFISSEEWLWPGRLTDNFCILKCNTKKQVAALESWIYNIERSIIIPQVPIWKQNVSKVDLYSKYVTDTIF